MESTIKIIDAWTTKHLNAWIRNTCYLDEQWAVKRGILKVVRSNPDLITGSDARSWPEIRRMAECA